MVGHILRQDQNNNCNVANDLDTRRKKDERKTKNCLEANG